ncbi:beta-1,4-N-acetylgalactosaminyltransferase 3 [Xenentodon cancila]
MISTFFPLKKLRRNGKYLLFGLILVVGALAIYNGNVATKAKTWSGKVDVDPYSESRNWRGDVDRKMRKDSQPDSVDASSAWTSSYTPQIWKPEFKGQANLHVFEDWCGSSTSDLRKNLHYPLYPHSRTTVQKLAVSPQWTNYGLRIFGYLHPYTDGDFVFALSSDDNSELWLSVDDSPLNLHLLAWVGKTGTEWTAPGEFEKYASQTSRPVRLVEQKRYFFEIIHKQNDRGTDHVEVAWKLLDQGLSFTVIESKHISLYVDESALLMSDVTHIPQTTASHQNTPTKQNGAAADMLREDPRDSLYHVHLINSKFLRGVLPDCLYQPTYTIKDFPLLRYQGLQFVHMSYVYPNDYTRLTHMETENSCFYPESPYYMKMFGFSRYMRLDSVGTQKKRNTGFGFQRRQSVLDEENDFDNELYEREKEVGANQVRNALFPDYGDDYDDYIQKRKRKLFSLVPQEINSTMDKSSDRKTSVQESQKKRWKNVVLQSEGEQPKSTVPLPSALQHLPQHRTVLKHESQVKKASPIKSKGKAMSAKRLNVKLSGRPGQINPPIPVDTEQLKAKQGLSAPSEQLNSTSRQIQMSHLMNRSQIQKIKDNSLQNPDRDAPVAKRSTMDSQWKSVTRKEDPQPDNTQRFTDVNRFAVRSNRVETDPRKSLRDKEIEMNMPLQQENGIYTTKVIARRKTSNGWSDVREEEGEARQEGEIHKNTESRRDGREGEVDSLWNQQENLANDDEELTPAPVFDPQVNWNQTFQVNHLDLQAYRSDWIDLSCNVSGNLLLQSRDALPIVKAFMDRLNEKHHGWFTLMHVVNVVKRVDGVQGSRYLLELEVKDATGQLLRLTHYIYALIRHSKDVSIQQSKPQLVLCNPVGFRWNPVATVHFIVPVKNQARWVQQLITDMEQLYRETGDENFNLIIADYNSTDMDVRKALEKSQLPNHQYVKLSGNFERSAGLQAGVDLIHDDHSIVFLCDLHIHFPPSIIDAIRKHCVEGYMAFAPIVLRLGCGTTPLEARGYWEVNGFGLLGIYKTDLDAIGGMNTREFKDRWGGEDWELLDRILQSGLEVERIYLRNFFHYYHSKRGMWNRQMSTGHR